MSTSAGDLDFQLGRFRLPLSARTPKIARGLAASVAVAWRLNEIADRVQLAVSEVVTNSFVHGDCPVYSCVIVEIARVKDEFHLTVHDGSRSLPRPREAEEVDETGRGLFLLQAMADDFGWYPTPFGKAVWFSMKVMWPEDVAA